MIRYKTYKIENVPTEKFPEMVVVTKGKKVEKKFINLDKAKVWIETEAALNLINKGARKVKKELSSIGFVETAW